MLWWEGLVGMPRWLGVGVWVGSACVAGPGDQIDGFLVSVLHTCAQQVVQVFVGDDGCGVLGGGGEDLCWCDDSKLPQRIECFVVSCG